MIMIEIQYNGTVGEPTHTASKNWHRIPYLYIYHLKRKRFVAFNLLCSSKNLKQLFKKEPL